MGHGSRRFPIGKVVWEIGRSVECWPETSGWTETLVLLGISTVSVVGMGCGGCG